MDFINMENSVLVFILTIAGTIISLCFIIIGFFLKVLHNDVRNNTQENGKNKGKIELVEQKANSEIARLTEVTQLEIKTLSQNVNNLATNIQDLVKVLIKKDGK